MRHPGDIRKRAGSAEDQEGRILEGYRREHVPDTLEREELNRFSRKLTKRCGKEASKEIQDRAIQREIEEREF